MFVGFAILPILAAVGLSADAWLAFIVENKLSRAIDTAGLAAGRVAYKSYADTDARDFFDANFPDGYLSATVTDFDIQWSADREIVTISATAQLPTRFMHLFGFENVTVTSRGVIRRENRGMELTLVMDNTGSMRSGGKMSTMKDAALDLVDIIYGDETTLPNVWISVVPYTAAVNVGPEYEDWLDVNDRVFDVPDPYDPSDWKGCVEARAAPFDGDDTVPADEPFTSFFYAADVDNEWTSSDVDETNEAQNDGYGPNLGCGPAITPLTQSKATVVDAIDEMLPWHRGGTTGNLGLSWGWRTISPDWRGLWQGETPADMPLDYGTPLMDKVVVILTDGQNQFFDWTDHTPDGGNGPEGSDYTAYGRLNEFGFATLGAARDELDQRMAETCQAMKDQGIIIYTITFGPSPDAQAQDLFRDCATTPAQYFHSPDNDTLADVFKSIGQALSNLRIVE